MFSQKKEGKLTASHRYDHLPLLPSDPGGFSRSWSYWTCPSAKVVLLQSFYKPFQKEILMFLRERLEYADY